MTGRRLHWPTLDTSPGTWRGRALRYLLIYLLLLLALVGVRYINRDVRPTLRAAVAQERQLLSRREELALEIQSLSNVQRIRQWAFANGMHRFAEAGKTSQTIPGIRPGSASETPSSSPRTVEVRTEWK